MHVRYCLNVCIYILSVMEPSVIRLQMVMQQFTMLKFFLSGLATSKLFYLEFASHYSLLLYPKHVNSV